MASAESNFGRTAYLANRCEGFLDRGTFYLCKCFLLLILAGIFLKSTWKRKNVPLHSGKRTPNGSRKRTLGTWTPNLKPARFGVRDSTWPAILCALCESIDLDAILTCKTSPFAEDATPIVVRTLSLRYPTPSCEACRFFSRLSGGWSSADGRRCHNYLLAFSAKTLKVLWNNLGDDDGAVLAIAQFDVSLIPGRIPADIWPNPTYFRLLTLAVQQNGLILPVADDRCLLAGRRIEVDQVEFNIVRSWIEDCKNNHVQCSHRLSVEVRYPKLLFDCHTRQTVYTIGNPVYTALSYVWGPADRLPTDSLPKLIEDAISVTIALGIRYMWVDRLCVPRGNRTSLHEELKSMAHIYRSAHLTLIAAAGNAINGLAGSGGLALSGRIQPSALVGQHSLVSTMQSPVFLIQSSDWAQRGWTYQEEIASTRRLYFTLEQVYFECTTSSFRETAIEASNLSSMLQFSERIVSKDSVGSIHKETDELKDEPPELAGAWHHIRAVSKRALTYDSDALDAVLGILNMPTVPNEQPRLHQIYGIPLPTILQDESALCTTYFACQLLWRNDTGQRQYRYPSWSWAGWTRSVLKPRTSYRRAQVDLACTNLLFDLGGGGGLISVMDLIRLPGLAVDDLPRVMHITAPMMPVQLRPVTTRHKGADIRVTLKGDRTRAKLSMATNLDLKGLRDLWPILWRSENVFAVNVSGPPAENATDEWDYVVHAPSLLVVAAVDGADKPFERIGLINVCGRDNFSHADGSMEDMMRLHRNWFRELLWEARTVQIG